MSDAQTKIIKQLLALNAVQFLAFLALKHVSMHVPAQKVEVQGGEPGPEQVAQENERDQTALGPEMRSSTKLSSLDDVRRKSCLDGATCACVETKYRNLCMFITIGVLFFVVPLMMLLMALATSSSSSDEDTVAATVTGTTTATTSTAGDSLRMLQVVPGGGDPETENLSIIQTWAFISLVAMTSFGYLELTPLMVKLYQQFRETRPSKPKNKALGGYSPDDPLRQLKMRESIYSFAFAVNLKNSKLEELRKDNPQESRPTSMIRSEVNLTALFCAFCQGFTSFLLL